MKIRALKFGIRCRNRENKAWYEYFSQLGIDSHSIHQEKLGKGFLVSTTLGESVEIGSDFQ